MKAVRKIIIVIASLALTVSMISCSNEQPGSSLSSALSAFIEHQTSQNYKESWNLSSENFRRSNDNDPIAYEKYARSYGIYPKKVSVLSISQFKDEAKIKVKVHFIETNGNNAGSAVMEWRFVREKDAWHYDKSRTISESAN
jgi:hypothetical protein